MRTPQTVILFLALTCQYLSADDKISAPDFSGYPQTEAFKFFISGHTSPAQTSDILSIVSFLGSDRAALLYSVNERGQENDVRFVYDLAAEASHSKQLSEGQLKDLSSAIKELPAKNVFPPIAQLVIVSFKENTNWITCAYDRTNLPPAMHRIYGIIGERFETKKNFK